MENVDEFYKKSNNINNSSNLLKGFFYMNLDKELNKKVAIDLGAGVGNDAKFLLDKGFKVTCVDKEEKSKEYILGKIKNTKNADFIIDEFEKVRLHKANLIYSNLSLHFCKPNKFNNLMDEIIKNVIPGGFFVREFSW